METVHGTSIPWEQQRALLISAVALKLPLLHKTLVEVYGEQKGSQIYDDLFEENFKKRAAQFEGKDIGDIMMAEVDMFPAMGWELHIEKKAEGGEPVWYEHLSRCPHLDATRAQGLPLPCGIICDMDCRMGEKYRVGTWERVKHMPAGDDECCFRITRCPE